MNDNLKNYQSQPDPTVWTSIQHSIRRKTLRKQMIAAGSALVLLGAAITTVVLWPEPNQQSTEKSLTAQQSPALMGFSTKNQTTNISMPKPEKVIANSVATTNAFVTPAQELVENISVTPQDTIEVIESAKAHRTSTTAIVTEPSGNKPASAAATPTTVQHQTPAATPQPVIAQQRPVTKASNPSAKSVVTSTVEDTIMWIPNAFIPQGDDASVAIFRPRINTSAGSISNYRMTIFSRAGRRIFTTSDINTGWDGTLNGSALPQAAYVYVITYYDRQQLFHQRKGTVTLIR